MLTTIWAYNQNILLSFFSFLITASWYESQLAYPCNLKFILQPINFLHLAIFSLYVRICGFLFASLLPGLVVASWASLPNARNPAILVLFTTINLCDNISAPINLVPLNLLLACCWCCLCYFAIRSRTFANGGNSV